MNDKTLEKLAQIQELIKAKEAIERKLEALLSPEKVVALPPDFSLNNEVYAIVKTGGENGIASTSILRALQQKYPDYGIDRRKVASILAYLKNSKKQIDLIGRGMYRDIIHSI